MTPIVIIGTGLAGYTTAREVRRHDTTTPLVIVTADDGTNYSKPMLSTAMARGKTAADLAQATAAAMAEQYSADIRTHAPVSRLDTDNLAVELTDGERIDTSHIILGIGADQIDPGLGGDAAGEVFAVNDLGAYASLRAALDGAKRVVIIGGGLIGCEFANDWARSGYDVTIIEPLERPLGRMLPELAGNTLACALENEGITLATGRYAERVERADSAFVVHDDQGGTYPADVVVRAIGLAPRTELARAAGLDINRGIVTDRHLQTSAPGIHALGDCAEVDGLFLPFIAPINAAARALGATLAGEPTAVDYPVMPVIVKTTACPIQLYAPPNTIAGEWTEENLDGGTRSLFHDEDGKLRGFALTGGAVREKGEWAKQVPGYFDNRS